MFQNKNATSIFKYILRIYKDFFFIFLCLFNFLRMFHSFILIPYRWTELKNRGYIFRIIFCNYGILKKKSRQQTLRYTGGFLWILPWAEKYDLMGGWIMGFVAEVFWDRCIDQKMKSSQHSLQSAVCFPWILPRAKKYATGIFFAPASPWPPFRIRSIIHPIKKPEA